MENNVQEIWKDVLEYEGYYMVSNFGRVKSLNYHRTKREGILSIVKDKQGGYSVVNLSKDGIEKQFLVHRLVWEAFNGRIPKNLQIDHIIPISNGGDNALINLRLCTPKENMNNPLSIVKKQGENHPFYNKHHTLETRHKISDANKGVPKAVETRQKMSENAAMKGKFSKEHNCSKVVIQLTLNDEFIRKWDSMSDIYRELGFAFQNISKCCNGKLPHAYGFHWMFEDDYQNLLHRNKPIQLMLFEEAI